MRSQGRDGLGALLAEAIPGSILHINTSDLLEDHELVLTSRVVQQSLTAEVRLEKSWARYLGITRGPQWQLHHALRWMRRAARFVRRPSTTGMRRLLNIELSHLNLLKRGLESGTPWILILEDDASTAGLPDLASGLTGMMSDIGSPGFVNLSRSFSLDQLGLGSLLTDTNVAWQGSMDRRVLISHRPATNTVCAILYSRDCVIELLRAWDTLPLFPVIPIDWKVNQILMGLMRETNGQSLRSWFVEPAPIIQMSMQPPGILAT